MGAGEQSEAVVFASSQGSGFWCRAEGGPRFRREHDAQPVPPSLLLTSPPTVAMPAPMVPSLGRLVLPLVLLLSFTSNLVFSTHVTCRWQPGKGSPAQFSYVQYCEAGIIVAVNNNKTTSAEYRCPPNNVFKLGAKIAEWGKIGPQLLEWCEYCVPRCAMIRIRAHLARAQFGYSPTARFALRRLRSQ